MIARWPGRFAGAALATLAVTAKVLTLVVAPAGGLDQAGGAQTGLGPFLDVALFTLVQLLYLSLTCLLVARLPRNPITWLMVAIVLFAALGGLSEAVTLLTISPSPWWWDLAASFRTWYFAPFVCAYVLLFHLFPTGRPISGWLGWGTRSALLMTALTTLVIMTGPADESSVPNPFEVSFPDWVRVTVSILLAVGWAITLVTIVPILVVRLRRSSGEERQQLKWFVFCVVAALFLWLLQGFAPALFLLAALLPGIGIGVAMLRYRLYDMDRIISRTTSYAAVTGLMVATYVVVVSATSTLVGTDSQLAVAAATLTAAALARPVLQSIQGVVDRRFDRSRYNAIRTIDKFAMTLRNEVDPHQVSGALVSTVQSSLHPDQVAVWVREPSQAG